LKIDAFGCWAGSRQAALAPELFDGEKISGTDADIGKLPFLMLKYQTLAYKPLKSMVAKRKSFYLNSLMYTFLFRFLYRNFWQCAA